ncbi:MAG TPA: HAMP domain-containing sensor histidine kinase [Vicinamibacterales bacterium]
MLSAALLVLLPALALLQYRWVGQVSTAEQERMQRNLRIAALQFRDAFDTEVGRAFLALQAGPTTARDGGSEQYLDRREVWLDTAEFPDIVANVFILDAPGDAPRVRRFAPATNSFVEVPWPASLEGWRSAFADQLEAFRADPFARRRPFPDDELLLAAPLRGFRPPPGVASRQDPPPFAYTVVELDRDYVVNEVLPALARRFFIHSDGDSYRVAVVDARDTDRQIYQSDPAAPVRLETADATQGFFGPRGLGFFFVRRGNGVDDRGRGSRGQPPPFARPDQAGPPPDPGRWLVAVQHRSGSLEAAVASVRRRNLGISFGVLLLLSVSVALMAQASRRVQRLARQQMEFVAGVSHELRTPIAVIRSAAENLSHGVVGGGERVQQYGQVMEGEARRLGEMVESVLQYAGVESGRGLGPLAPIAIADLVDQAVEGARRSMDGDVEVERSIAADLPVVLGDGAALTSAVQNLVVNAFKYGGDARWVGVRATHVNRGRYGEVHITVEDRGPGIPSDELPHIFEPFYRGTRAVGEQIHGNGLGLSLVQRIARAHGGSVSVRTRDAHGTAFTIVLPAAAAHQSPKTLTGGARAAAI